jgi:hypothetical protein
MKIRLSELKQIIKEEVEGAASYKRWKELQSVHGLSADDKMAHAAKSGYFGNDLPELFKLKASSDGNYNTFFYPAKKMGYPASRIHDFFSSSFKSLDELEAAAEELSSLESRFKKEEVTDERDRVYGRKSYQVIDTMTDKVVDKYNDRQGSLGT